MTCLLKNTSNITVSLEQTSQNVCFVGDTGGFKYKAWCLNSNQTAIPYFIVCNDLIQNVCITVYSVHHIFVIEDMTLPFEILWNNIHPSPYKTQINAHTHTHTQINGTCLGDHLEWHGITISFTESFVTPEALSPAFFLKYLLMSRHHLVISNHSHSFLHCILQWLLFLLEIPTVITLQQNPCCCRLFCSCHNFVTLFYLVVCKTQCWDTLTIVGF